MQKAGPDKFAPDMAVDLKNFNIAPLSIWMGSLKTDRLKMVIESDREKYRYPENVAETPEFTGHVIRALFNDPDLMKISGQTVIGAEMAAKYGIKDEGGRQPRSCRETNKVEPRMQYRYIIR